MISIFLYYFSWFFVVISTLLFLYDPLQNVPHIYTSYFLFFALAGLFFCILKNLRKDSEGMIIQGKQIGLDGGIFFIFSFIALLATIYYILVEQKNFAEYYAILIFYGLLAGVISILILPLIRKYIVLSFPRLRGSSWWNDYIKELIFYMSILRVISPIFFLGILLFGFSDFGIRLQFDTKFLTSLSSLIVFSQFFPEYKFSKNLKLFFLVLLTLLASGLLFILVSEGIFLRIIFISFFLIFGVLGFFCGDSVKKFAHRVFSL